VERRGLLYPLAAALIFLLTIVLVNPNVESGMNDDWSFIYTVRELAATGRLHYNGWSAPLIGFQAYWGALFVKLFGFSFFAVRASVWVLALLSIPMVWALLRSIELSESQSFFTLIIFLLSPLVLPSTLTFMTDMPAFWLCAAALLSALNAWRAQTERSCFLWIIATAFSGVLSGSVRQFYWLASICFLTTLGFTRLRSFRGRALLLICVGFTGVFGALCSLWLSHQPYVPLDPVFQELHEMAWADIFANVIGAGTRTFIGVAVLSLPVSLALAWQQRKTLRPWFGCLLIGGSSGLCYWLSDPLPWQGNTITNYGIIMSGTVSLGEKPVILSKGLMVLLSSIGLTAAIYALVGFVSRLRGLRSDSGLRRFALLTLPFLLIYTLVLLGRSPGFGLYDRYLVPHLFIVSILALGLYATQTRKISGVSWTVGGVFALYAIATTHDYFAEARAKLRATQEVLSAGYKRTAVISGFEFDSWTQTLQSGHVNNSLIKMPPNAYAQVDDCNGPDEVQAWWRSLDPSLEARYVVTLSPIAGMQPSDFPNIEYRRWLPFGVYRAYVETIEKNAPLLTCKPDTGS
jgi:hypothetical protein